MDQKARPDDGRRRILLVGRSAAVAGLMLTLSLGAAPVRSSPVGESVTVGFVDETAGIFDAAYVLIDPAAGLAGDIEDVEDGGPLTTVGAWIRNAGDAPTYIDNVAWGGAGYPGMNVLSIDGGPTGGAGAYYNTGYAIQSYDTLDLSILAAWRNAWWVDDATAEYTLGVVDSNGLFNALASATYAPGAPGPYARDQIFHRSPVLSYTVQPTDAGMVAVHVDQAVTVGAPMLLPEIGSSPPHDDDIIDAGRVSLDGVSLTGALREAPPSPPTLLAPADDAEAVIVSADLDWIDAAGAETYDVYFGTAPSPPLVGQTAESAWPLPELAPDTTYYWQVAAGNTYGTTASAVWSFTTRPLAAAGAPNILLLFADDLGWCDIATGQTNLDNGSTYIQTPNIDRLASEGLSFPYAYVYQNCVPSRAALMLGQNAERSRIHTYGSTMRDASADSLLVGPPDGENISTEAFTFAERLQHAGYTTIHIGKFHVADGATQITADHGFDISLGASPPEDGHPGTYFASEISPGVWEFNNPRVDPNMDVYAAPYTQDYIDQHRGPYANGANPDSLLNTPKHLSDAMADAAIDTLTAQLATGRPFFVNLAFNAVHTPIESRPDLLAKYAGIASTDPRHSDDAYAGLTEGMDQAIGRVLDFLDDPDGDGDSADSIADDTVVFFLSDNGPWPGASSAAPLTGVKNDLTEGGIRVPVIVRRPGQIPAGATTTDVIQVSDFYPTLLELAGGAPPDPADHVLDGASFAPILLNQPAAPRPRTIYYHFPGYFSTTVTPVSAAIRHDGNEVHKLYYYYEDQRYALYNLSADLGETNDLLGGTPAPEHYQLAAEMSRDLRAHLDDAQPLYPTYRATGETVPPPAPLPLCYAFGESAGTVYDGLSTADLLLADVRLTISAVGANAVFDSDSAGLGVVSDEDVLPDPTANARISGDLPVPRAVRLQFDRDVEIASVTLDAFDADGVEALRLQYVSGVNPFTALTGYNGTYQVSATDLTYTSAAGGAGQVTITFGVSGQSPLLLAADSVIKLTADPATAGGIRLVALCADPAVPVDPDCNHNGVQDDFDKVVHGDWNANGRLDDGDLMALPPAMGGPGQLPPLDLDCADLGSRAFDLDRDDDVDMRDFALLTAGLMVDAFVAPHDYLGGDVDGTAWDGVLNVASASVLDAAVSTNGRLTIQSAGTYWRNSEVTGPLVYRLVTGDFDAVARYASVSEVNYHTAFIGVRDPELGADGFEDWMYVGQQNRVGGNDFVQFRLGDNGSHTDTGLSGIFEFVRLVRSGDDFSAYASADGGFWTQVGSTVSRPDLPATLQVGVGQASFGNGAATVEFETFSIVTP